MKDTYTEFKVVDKNMYVHKGRGSTLFWMFNTVSTSLKDAYMNCKQIYSRQSLHDFSLITYL